MEVLNITNTNQDSINRIRTCEFKHHFEEIKDDKIVQVIVNKVNEDTKVLGFKTTVTTEFDIILIYINDLDQKIKRTTKIQQQKITTKTPKRVLERQNLPKFGAALYLNNDVTSRADNVFIEYIDENNLPSRITPKKNIFEDNTKITKGANLKFSDRKKLKDYKSSAFKITEPPKEPKQTKYVPPGRRDKERRQQKYTVHISGFLSDFTKDEFFHLIPNNIKVDRVTLPRNGNLCKGYGFIDLNSKEDMKSIIKFFDGKPYKHMILHANSKK